MSQIGDLAESLYFEQKYCCSEAVWLAFAMSDNLSEAEKNAGNKLAFAFCGGLGNGQFCGALAGGFMIIGRYFGRVCGEERNDTTASYREALTKAFMEKYGSIDCSSLKPTDPTKSRLQCKTYVRFVAETLADLLDKGLEEDEDCG